MSKSKEPVRTKINSTSILWLSLLNMIMQCPTVSPRGMETKEQLCVSTKVNMNEPMVNIKSRSIGQKFRYAEAAWILSGDNRVKTIAPFSKMITKFSDDGVRFFGAYGVKVVDQLPFIIDTLKEDPSSRQAVINIWRENPRKTKDVPCTLSLQFLIRDGELNCMATMRSSDAWLGWVYDVYNFSMISLYVMLQLKSQHNVKYKLGHLYLTVGSQHLYKENFKKAQICLEKADYFRDEKSPTYLKDGEQLVNLLWQKALEDEENNQLVLDGMQA
ncbi:thymidylate synthase [Pelagibacter phage HTVC200P]|nr:thymidylate synthase [Pelagibacter phage HTVC200P]